MMLPACEMILRHGLPGRDLCFRTCTYWMNSMTVTRTNNPTHGIASGMPCLALHYSYMAVAFTCGVLLVETRKISVLQLQLCPTWWKQALNVSQQSFLAHLKQIGRSSTWRDGIRAAACLWIAVLLSRAHCASGWLACWSWRSWTSKLVFGNSLKSSTSFTARARQQIL